MGILFGYLEDVSITAPFVTTEDSKPIYENSAESSNGKNGGSLKESESDSPHQKANKKRGRTRGKGGKLQYLDGNRWVLAVYHHTIRDFLIKQASQKGKYTYPRERGPGLDDETSFLESQKDWGPERDKNWADILYVFQKGENHKDPKYELKIWKFHGKIVISAYDNRPMRLIRDLPDTLSSALHGRDMEAMKRTDPRIQQRDFMARMPLRHTTQAGTRRPLQSASSIGMRMTRFRQQQGLLSWIGRDGSLTIRNALWERLPPENKVANSIRGLEPPSIAEQQEIKKGNAGKFLNRAGRRALTSEERARRKEIAERRLKQRREREFKKATEDGAGEEIIEGKRPVGDLGVDGLAQSDAEQREHHPQRGRRKNENGEPYGERARKLNKLKRRLRERQEASPGGGILDNDTSNADGLAEPDPEQSGYNTRPDRLGNRFRQAREEQARRHEILERLDRDRQNIKRLRDGISGDGSRGRGPAKKVDTGHLTEPTAEQSQEQIGLRGPNNGSMQSPPPNNNSPKLGKDRNQAEQGYNQVGNPSEGGNNTDYSDDLFGSDLPAPPRGFDFETFLRDVQANIANSTTIPSPPEGCDLEDILAGLPPETFNIRQSPSPPKSNQPSLDEDWDFGYGLPEPGAGSADQRSSTPNNNNYPSPPDYNFNFEEQFNGESENPYYLQPPRQF